MIDWTPKEEHSIGLDEINTILKEIKTSCKSFSRFEGGVINPLYVVETKDNTKLVLRLTHPSWKKLKTLNEVMLMKFLLEKTSVPVPKILSYDLTTEKIGYEYLLMEFVDGEQLSVVFSNSSDDEKKEYLSQLANYMNEWMSFEFDSIGSFQQNMSLGPVASIGEGPFKTFSKYIRKYIELKIKQLENTKFDHFCSPLKNFIENVVNGFSGDVSFVLTHCDVDLKNILVKNKKVVAVLDWEWAKAGPADEDINCIDWLDDNYKEFMLSKLKFPKGFDKRKDIYDILNRVTALTSYKAWFPNTKEAEGFAHHQDKMLKKLLKKYI